MRLRSTSAWRWRLYSATLLTSAQLLELLAIYGEAAYFQCLPLLGLVPGRNQSSRREDV